jgi:hypothetical protein
MISGVSRQNTAQASAGHEQLYVPVDRDDIISGTRDAVELKPIMSNEDAFFMIPETEEVL